MKRTIFMAAIAAAIGFTSCQKEDVAPIIEGNEGSKENVTTLVANYEPGTRMSLSVDHDGLGIDRPLWREGDILQLWELAAANITDAGETGYVAATKTGATTAADVVPYIVFTLVEGEGTTTGVFTTDGEGLDPDKKYVAFHSNKLPGQNSTSSLISYQGTQTNISGSANLNAIRIKGSGIALPTSMDGAALSEDNIAFYAPVEFDTEGNVLPMSFRHTIHTIIELNISKAASITEDITIKKIALSAYNPANVDLRAVFNYASFCVFDDNMNLVIKNGINPGSTFTLTTNSRPVLTDTQKIRFPIAWNNTPGSIALGHKWIRGVITFDVAGVEKTYSFQEQMNSIDNANLPPLLIGKTYVKDIMVDALQ